MQKPISSGIYNTMYHNSDYLLLFGKIHWQCSRTLYQ